MIDDTLPPVRRRRRSSWGQWVVFAAAGAFAAAALPRAGTTPPPEQTPVPTPYSAAEAAVAGGIATVPEPPVSELAWMLDRTPVLGSNTRGLAQNYPRTAALVAPARPAPIVLAALPEKPTVEQGEPEDRVLQTVPLPVARPAELRRLPVAPRVAERSMTPRTRVAAARNVEAERSFFDTVFGIKPEPSKALAYASPGVDPSEAPMSRPSAPFAVPSAGAGVAIYNITAQTVTLPSGERLEAHSGLGASMDNPDFVHLRMRGATPPGTYDLTEREALFHGVRAIRLHPVGGPAAVHGRTGLLAHTYMLRGQPGASNGCVVFANYNRFLQAYLRGDIRRLVVVAGDGSDRIARLFGRGRREARAD